MPGYWQISRFLATAGGGGAYFFLPNLRALHCFAGLERLVVGSRSWGEA
jgi:hypothetical protein